MRVPRPHLIASRKGTMGKTAGITAALAAVFSISAPAVIAQSQPAARFVAVLDAAHGGDNAGASLAGGPEKAYTLAMSVKLRSLMAARGVTVVTTRDSDAAVSPDQRAEIANRAHAQTCLSLHASESGSGVHVFVSSLAPVAPSPLLPWKTAQAAWIQSSLALAGTINSALTHAGVPVTLGRIALPGIDSMTCPAVAVEITPDRSANEPGNGAGKAGLDNPDYQARVADALAAALVEWRSAARGGQEP